MQSIEEGSSERDCHLSSLANGSSGGTWPSVARNFDLKRNQISGYLYEIP